MTNTLDNLIYNLRQTHQQLDDVRQELSLLRTRSLMQPQYYPASMRQGLAEQENSLLSQEQRILEQIREMEKSTMTSNPNAWNETAVSQPDSTRDVIIWSPGVIDIEVGWFAPEKGWFEKDMDGGWMHMHTPPTHWMDICSPEGKTF